MKIVIDTNIFVYSVRFKIDIFSRLGGNEIFTTESVMRELEKLGKGNSRDAKAAALALLMLKEKINGGMVSVLPSGNRSADECLLELGKCGYAIITQDRELLERLKSAGCAFGYIKQKKYFEFEGSKSRATAL